jgi:acetyltransferase
LKYPEKYEARVKLKGGEEVLLRPIKTTDTKLAKDFYERLSARTKYLRFFTPKKEATEDRIKKFTTVDYKASIVVIAISGDEMVGAARYDWDKDEKYLEMAETVRDDWQGKGLGTVLFRHIMKIAKDNGYNSMTVLILGENKKALNILKKTVGELRMKGEGNFIRATFDI